MFELNRTEYLILLSLLGALFVIDIWQRNYYIGAILIVIGFALGRLWRWWEERQ